MDKQILEAYAEHCQDLECYQQAEIVDVQTSLAFCAEHYYSQLKKPCGRVTVWQ